MAPGDTGANIHPWKVNYSPRVCAEACFIHSIHYSGPRLGGAHATRSDGLARLLMEGEGPLALALWAGQRFNMLLSMNPEDPRHTRVAFQSINKPIRNANKRS